jgi:hypothetical protein
MLCVVVSLTLNRGTVVFCAVRAEPAVGQLVSEFKDCRNEVTESCYCQKLAAGRYQATASDECNRLRRLLCPVVILTCS